MKKKNLIILIILIILVDKLIKFGISNTIKIGNSVNFIGQAIRLTYVQNTGGAFSIGNNNTNIIAFVNIIIITILLIFLFKNYNNIENIIKMSVALIIAGGTGNLIDRICFRLCNRLYRY